MDWIKEIGEEKIRAILEKDVALIYQECGLDVLLVLWQKLKGLNLYISEAALFELKRIYIRGHYNPNDPHGMKLLAVKLDCSQKFVQEALATTDEKGDDPRQGKLI